MFKSYVAVKVVLLLLCTVQFVGCDLDAESTHKV